MSNAIDRIAGALHRLSEVSVAAVFAANQLERLAIAAERFVAVVEVEAPRFVDAVERLSGKEPTPRPPREAPPPG